MNCASIRNRDVIADWTKVNSLLSLTVSNAEYRGAAVILLSVIDGEVVEFEVHARIFAKAKDLLGYEGITHLDGIDESGLCATFYINAFPGTVGDFRAWVGGVRSEEDVLLLLENLQYAWYRAKVAVLKSEIAKSHTGHSLFHQSAGISDTRVVQLLELRENSENIAALSVALSTCRDEEYQDVLREFSVYWKRLYASAEL